MVGSYQTITYKRYAVQSATKFKAKIVDIPFCDPESGFSILFASRIEDGKSIVLKGIIPNPVENAYITYQGHWEQDARRGTQYVKVESCKIDYEAGGTDSIYELLTSGYVPGVGPVTAKKIIKAFGADSLKIIEKSPEKLTELAGIKEKAAKKIHDAYIHIAKDQELISFLLPFISMQKINAVLKEYGDSKQALAAIKENPYCLYQDVSGIGFAASDRIALVGLGMDRKDQRRVEAIVLHSLEVQAQMEGHSFVWLNQLMACVATTVEKELHESRIPEQSIRDAVNGARRKGLLVAEKSSGNASGKPLFCVYLRRYWALECDITFLCHTLHHCMNAACGIVSKADVDRAIQNVQMKDGFLLDDTQKQAAYTVYGSDSQNVTVITGGPGSGKTTIIKTIIEAFMVAKGSYYKEEDILLCAPTGRASARMREATGHAASTIQSAYFGCFDNEASVIVVDEFSMCNLETAHMVFSLASHGCKLVIVGDPDQLPAIGAGNVLRDLIDSGEVNVCKLSSCHRNMGAIVENAIHINAGEQTSTFRQDESFLLIPATKGMEIRTTALLNYFHFVRKNGEVNDLDNRHAEDGIRKGVQNICLLTPVRKKGSGYISATDLNLLIRDKLNPATYENSGFIESLKGVPEQGFDYRIGDRVMLCKNHRGSFVNGDMGFITSFEPKALGQDGAMICNAYTVRFDNPCDVDGECFEMIVSRKTMQSEFALAYAMTVHKSQGSEFKAVVVAFDTGWKQLQQRNLLYTAVTRSKNECRIVGNMDAVDVAIDTNDIENRNSLLKNRLQHYNNEKYLDIHMTNFGTSGTDCFAE